jgi:hypothetical protein
LSISIFGTGNDTSRSVAELREGLPPGIDLWAGGAGAAHLENLPTGVSVLSSLDDLDEAVQRL